MGVGCMPTRRFGDPAFNAFHIAGLKIGVYGLEKRGSCLRGSGALRLPKLFVFRIVGLGFGVEGLGEGISGAFLRGVSTTQLSTPSTFGAMAVRVSSNLIPSRENSS